MVTGVGLDMISPMSSWCSWNVQGFGDPIDVCSVSSFLMSHWDGFCCMLGTKVRKPRFDSAFASLIGDWECVSCYGTSALGQLWVM